MDRDVLDIKVTMDERGILKIVDRLSGREIRQLKTRSIETLVEMVTESIELAEENRIADSNFNQH